MAAQEQPEPDVVPDEPEARSAPPTWSRVVIFGAAALAALLIGATIGLVIGQNRSGDDTPAASPRAGSVDVGFAQDMSRHHLQAVTMANWARDHSDDPAIKQLAFDIASVQLEQVGRMKGWLMLWGQPEEPLGEPMQWMSGGHGHGHGSNATATSDGGLMPGMASEEELAKLRSLSGEELDVYFLQLMLRHHQGGVDMAQYGYDHASEQAVRTLARSMLVSQGAEMDTMRGMLAERGAEPLPFP
ncbi:DUF305 domain-containing protein [Saccharomonospora glauca]|jgi:uncharacterized protein (DUF305 family)|uniref:DUF305 domain-containing protein n=1 Tax=Saccharomonospora glauca K62 TaxID=928724 RepID=I1D5K7_9PSEU|nr:DUF305 domain-containing protein [Saccharomonospora glauca]EIF00232.1 hypothetical protein SacglDRAFT_03370 [Saccharomonospora glauca K62]